MTLPFDEMHRRVFAEGQKTKAQQATTRFFEEQAALQQRAAEVAIRMLGEADQLGADGDPFKEEIARLIKGSVVYSLQAMQRVTTGQGDTGEAKETLRRDPFCESSPPCSESLSNESPEPQAISHESRVQLPSPAPRRRGRPPGSKNRPKSS